MFSSIKKQLHQSVTRAWFEESGWLRPLIPLSLIFSRLACQRKARYLKKNRWNPPVPVLVVGNITVGGTGKTPLVASLVQGLKARGYRPGVVSRGFGGQARNYPIAVTATASPRQVGDEPVMLARQLGVPVVVDPDRVSAARFLCAHHDCNLVIADDGLQHYNLKRHVELLVLDGQRLLGNGYCLPAGPLREGAQRLHTVDRVFSNGPPRQDPGVPCICFQLLPQPLEPVNPDAAPSLPSPAGCRVHGVAGIGNPGRFFNTLAAQGFEVIPHSFPDHHPFTAADIHFDDNLPVIMTAKDAVKCRALAGAAHWYLPVLADLSAATLDDIANLIKASVRTEHG